MSECYVGASSILFASRTSGVRVSVPHYYHAPFSAGQCEYVNNKVRSWLLPPSLFLLGSLRLSFSPSLFVALIFSARRCLFVALGVWPSSSSPLTTGSPFLPAVCRRETHWITAWDKGYMHTHILHARMCDERRACVRLHTGPGSHGGAFPPGLFIDLHEVL